MASADQLKGLIRSYADGDKSLFLSIAMQIAAHEAKRGHGKLAEELKRLVDKAKSLGETGSPTRKIVPLSQHRGELSSLLEVSYPQLKLGEMVLSEEIEKRLVRIIKEQRKNSQIREYGLSPRRKLLLVGPPGTGKTMTASMLAGELNIPLFQVRLDTLITKFMGESAAKLRQVFSAIAEVRGVYFFDEFDAIGSQRGLGNDVGEARRILNSFLQMIEQDDSNSLIISATNHSEILDYALFRRFDDILEYSLPTQQQSLLMLKNRLAGFIEKGINLKTLATKTEGLSYADITKSVDDAIKEYIVHDKAKVDMKDLKAILQERKEIKDRNFRTQ